MLCFAPRTEPKNGIRVWLYEIIQGNTWNLIFKGATKLHFSRVVIILVSTGLYKSVFSAHFFFWKTRFSSFCVLVFTIFVFKLLLFCSMFLDLMSFLIMSDLITFSNFHLIQVLIYKFGWFLQSHECLFPEKFKKPSKILTAWGVSKYGVISGPYFPVFRLNMEIYSVNLCIQPEYRKMRTRNNSEFGHISRSRCHSIYASSF